jgi:SAM-dependent methyltransferase
MDAIDRRGSHVDVNMSLRTLKAVKIEKLLNLGKQQRGGTLLEVGTGSGGIAHYFASKTDLDLAVSAVDVEDNRQVFDKFDFHVVDGCILPFEDASFDIVISNHVIEHVGQQDDQLLHLRELRRVMKPGGIGYLAVPNRWMLVEPHYRLPFLSWLPSRWRSAYVRGSGRGRFYDCEPLSMRQLEGLLAKADLNGESLGLRAIETTLFVENRSPVSRHLFSVIPRALLARFLPLIPTLIYRISR